MLTVKVLQPHFDHKRFHISQVECKPTNHKNEEAALLLYITTAQKRELVNAKGLDNLEWQSCNCISSNSSSAGLIEC